MYFRVPLTAVKRSVNQQIRKGTKNQHIMMLYVIVLMYEFKNSLLYIDVFSIVLPISFRFADSFYAIFLALFVYR